MLLSGGNAAIYRRPGLGAIPVNGLGPSVMAIAWRKDDHRGVIRDFVDAATAVAQDPPPR
ncbi:hypothetical protein ACLMAJ_15910 [Nocardia sp. KC 131]|uniref:hypothetical protein n=1 Tax=Nocardia arseniciresistens TaxID=3392119 RepID=UPI00398EB9B8